MEILREYKSEAITGKDLKEKLRGIAAECENDEDAEAFWDSAKEIDKDGVYVKETSFVYYSLEDYTELKGADFVEKYVGGNA